MTVRIVTIATCRYSVAEALLLSISYVGIDFYFTSIECNSDLFYPQSSLRCPGTRRQQPQIYRSVPRHILRPRLLQIHSEDRPQLRNSAPWPLQVSGYSDQGQQSQLIRKKEIVQFQWHSGQWPLQVSIYTDLGHKSELINQWNSNTLLAECVLLNPLRDIDLSYSTVPT